MKKIKIFANIYLVLMPYLMYWLVIASLQLESLLLSVCVIVLLCAIGVAACVLCNMSALTGKSDMKSAVMNMIIKICYIPAYVQLRFFFLGMLNPWLMMASWIPLVVSISLLGFSRFCNIGTCVSLYRKGKCKLSTAVILCLMGFVYILDIIGGIIQCFCARKPENKQNIV